MRNITQTTIEHIEVVSNRSYDQVTASLQERLGSFGDSRNCDHSFLPARRAPKSKRQSKPR